jgi:hypothetical protein
MQEPTDADVVEAELASKARQPRPRPARPGGRLTGRELLDREISETEWKRMVREFAQRNGWRVFHVRPVHDGRRWRTPAEGDPGFVDLVLAKVGFEPIHAELKPEIGWHWQPGQQEWLEALGGELWIPSMWPQIQRRLAAMAGGERARTQVDVRRRNASRHPVQRRDQ